MTINNINEFVDNLWDWAILDGCFGKTRIKPTDIDGLVERNGKYLILEAKSPGVEISQGQMITFNHMIQDGNHTIIVIWGEKDNPEKLLLMTSKAIKNYENSSIEELRHIVSAWFDYANQTPLPRFD